MSPKFSTNISAAMKYSAKVEIIGSGYTYRHRFSYHSPSVNFSTQSAPLVALKEPARGGLAERSFLSCSMSVVN